MSHPPIEHNPHVWADILVGSRAVPGESAVVDGDAGPVVEGEHGPELTDLPDGTPVETNQSDEDAPVDVNGDGQLDTYEQATKAELVAQCEQRGLPTSGTKAELVRRLQDHDAEATESA